MSVINIPQTNLTNFIASFALGFMPTLPSTHQSYTSYTQVLPGSAQNSWIPEKTKLQPWCLLLLHPAASILSNAGIPLGVRISYEVSVPCHLSFPIWIHTPLFMTYQLHEGVQRNLKQVMVTFKVWGLSFMMSWVTRMCKFTKWIRKTNLWSVITNSRDISKWKSYYFSSTSE